MDIKNDLHSHSGRYDRFTAFALIEMTAGLITVLATLTSIPRSLLIDMTHGFDRIFPQSSNMIFKADL